MALRQPPLQRLTSHHQRAHRLRPCRVVQPGRLACRYRKYRQDGEGVDAKTGIELLTLKGHAESVNSASFSADASRVVTGSDDHTAKVWDAKTGTEVLALKGHAGGVNSASFSADGLRIVTGSDDHTAKVWD